MSGFHWVLASLSAVVGVVVAAVVLARRLGGRWTTMGFGALAFVVSQVVHLPVVVPVQGWLTKQGTWTLALVLGFAAGLCEEPARWLFMRVKAAHVARREDAIAFGVGHGGIEALLLTVLGLAQALTLTFQGDSIIARTKAMAPDRAEAVQKAVDTVRNMGPSLAAAGAFERVAAISVHVGLSLLVYRAIATRRPAWLLLAIALHALVDSSAVVLMKREWSPWAIEAVVAVLAFGILAAALRARPAVQANRVEVSNSGSGEPGL